MEQSEKNEIEALIKELQTIASSKGYPALIAIQGSDATCTGINNKMKDESLDSIGSAMLKHATAKIVEEVTGIRNTEFSDFMLEKFLEHEMKEDLLKTSNN